MATRPEDGVVDADHRVFGVPNLFIVDGSVLPTQGAANPALTIMALAARAAHRLTTRQVHADAPTPAGAP
jgi:choline dehydrogenase-like flavoprotein